MSGPRWYVDSDGFEKLQFSLDTCAYANLCTAVSRRVDARSAASGQPPGSPARVLEADLRTALDDRRAAFALSLGFGPEQLQRDGLRQVEPRAMPRSHPHPMIDPLWSGS